MDPRLREDDGAEVLLRILLATPLPHTTKKSRLVSLRAWPATTMVQVALPS